MADYYPPQLLAMHLGVSEAELGEFEAQGYLSPVYKDGRKFYPARQMHRLRAALRLAGKRKVSLDQAFGKVESSRARDVALAGE